MIRNLNKQNFWKEIEKTYPKAFKSFGLFIDAYKKEICWHQLFNQCEWGIKFHDVPVEMQLGIMLRFAMYHGLQLHYRSYKLPVVKAETIKLFFCIEQSFNPDLK